MVWGLQHGASTSSVRICDAWRVVSLTRIVRGQAGGVAMEMKAEALAASSPE